jgi:hypothetical protein
MQYSTTVNNARLDAIETAISTAPKFHIYDGTMPANCGTAAAGTKIVDTALPSDWLGAAAAGVKAKAGAWNLTGIAGGLARYFRVYDAAGSVCHMQGNASQAWAGSTAYALNQHTNNGGNVYKCTTAGTSASSGGPSGTGTGISDGSAVWAYVGPAELILDNTSIANAQAVTVSAFSLTAGNA